MSVHRGVISLRDSGEPLSPLSAVWNTVAAITARNDTAIHSLDKARGEDALDYLEASFRGIPDGFVFVALCKQLKESWTVTLSYEALELLGGAQNNLLVQGPHPKQPEKDVFHWFAMCDALQSLTCKKIGDVEISDFVLPLYFTTGEQDGRRNDFLGTTGLKSLGVTKDGYIGFHDPKAGKNTTYFGPNDTKAKRRIALKDASKARWGYVRTHGDATVSREESNDIALTKTAMAQQQKEPDPREKWSTASPVIRAADRHLTTP